MVIPMPGRSSPPNLSGFEIVRLLGTGGMAAVWEARQISLDRTVAIKVLSAESASRADVALFEREARAAAALKHPGIVQIHDASVEGGTYYLVMEFVDGYTCGEWLRAKGRFREQDALLVGECVADAMAYAWEKARLVHCDLKPDNVMVDADGTVKVADLGLARTLKSTGGGGGPGEVYGTPQYMSPEQIRGAEDLDGRSDIYALGAMLYHLLAGRMMFEGSADEVVTKQLSHAPPDIHAHNSAVSQATWKLLCWMLRKNRAERPSNWRVVRAEMARIRSELAHGRKTELKVSTALPAEHSRLMSGKRKAHRSGAPSRRARPRTRGLSVASPSRREPASGVLVWGGLLLVVALAVWAMDRASAQRRSRPSPPRPPVRVERFGAPVGTTPEEDLYQSLEAARKWAAANPEDVEGAMTRYRAVAGRAKGDRIGYLASREAQKLAEVRDRQGVAGTMAKLDPLAEAFVVSQRFAEAAEVYAGYRGPFAVESREARRVKARDLEQRQRDADRNRAKEEELAEKQWSDVLDGVAARLAEGQLPEARDLAVRSLRPETRSPRRHDGAAIVNLLDRAGRMDERVLQSFLAQKGQPVTVETVRGTRSFVVADVRDGQILGETKLADVGSVVKVGLNLAELSLRERLRRMGSDQEPEVAIAKGIVAIQTGSLANAKRFFAAAGPHLSDRVVALLEARSVTAQEPPATPPPPNSP
jgi:serine/threonine protein kinase